MKAVMLSLRPHKCCSILEGKTTAVISKTSPNLDEPFNAYLYCIDDNKCIVKRNCGYFSFNENGELESIYPINGKVVGKLIHVNIQRFKAKIRKKNGRTLCTVYSVMYCIGEDGCKIEWVRDKLPYGTRVTTKELAEYLGLGDHEFYVWRFWDCKPYDRPKELTYFSLDKAPKGWCYVEEEDV